jgi:uroporphyrinogen decarboxylase
MTAEFTGRERVTLALQHRKADRVPMTDGVLTNALERWYNEGLPRSTAPAQFFGWEMMEIRADASLRFPSVTLEETEDHTVVRDSYGAAIKSWKDVRFLADRVDFTIKTRADWAEHKGRTQWDKSRVNWEAARRAYDEGRARGQYICYGGAISWDATLPMIGAETMLLAMAAEPDWIQEMFQAFADLWLAGAEEMLGAGFEFDAAFVCDDMGYRSGTLFSPRMYQQLFFPHDKRVCDFFNARHMPVILHSCGQVSKLIPKLIEAGYACLQPLEVKAGMDLVALKKQYGQDIAFMGGIDVRKVSDPDPHALELEIASKIPAAKAGGGYIYELDGPVMYDASLVQYRHLLDLVHHYGRYE